jgi:hypothetical protein
MFSSKYRRTLALTLVLSAGAASLARAEAAPGRSGAQNGGPAVHLDLIPRTFLEAVKNLWEKLKDAPVYQPAGHSGHGTDSDEGPSVCPHGGHPHP